MSTSLQEARTAWLIEGIVFLILGILAVAMPVIATFSFELVIGWLLILGGLVQGYRALKNRRERGFWPSIFSSILYLIVGILMIAYPFAGVLSLTLLLSAFLFIEAIAKFVLGFQLRAYPHWGWLLLSGLLALILAGIIWAGWPGTALWVIGLMVGINMIFLGVSLITFSRSIPKEEI